MKILAIIGSPRKNGNTYKAVERIKENLLAYDKNIEFEYLFLKDCDLKMCTGCFTCISKGERLCPLKDDRDAIMSKMTEADGIVFAAPCFAMGVPAVMKNFIDRFAYTLHRPCFFDKSFLAVATVGGVRGLKQTLGQLALLSAGGRLVKSVGISCPPMPMAGFDKRADKKIRKAARDFYRSLKDPRRKAPGMGDWAHFHSFKASTAFELYQSVCPADCSYYSEKDEYFYPLKGHPMRRLVGKLFRGLMRSGLKLLVKNEES
jgi:multimeric flavodoxin WrbA